LCGFTWRSWGSKNCKTYSDIYLRLGMLCFKIEFEEKWGGLSGIKCDTI